MSLEILLDTMLGLSPNSLQILFRDVGHIPCRLASASTLCISTIHFLIASTWKRPIFCFACVLPPRSPEEAVWVFSSCPSVCPDNEACVPSSSDMTLIFLQVEDDVELHQMPKRSRRDDLAKAMIGGKPKSSDTGASKGKGKGRGKPINIPLGNISPELKKILVQGMIKGGRAKLVKKSQIKGQGK